MPIVPPGNAAVPNAASKVACGLALFAGLVGFACAILVSWRGALGTSESLHGRAPFFDFAIYHAQAAALSKSPFVLGDQWFYPPFALLVFRPFALLSLSAAQTLWLACQAGLVLALAAINLRTLELLPPVRRYGAALGFTLGGLPLAHCISAGQVSLLLLLLCIVGLARADRVGAAALATAASIKLYPFLFALPYLVRLRFSYLRDFALWFLGFSLVVPAALLPVPVIAALARRSLEVVSNSRRPVFDEAQSVRAVFDRLFSSGSIFDSVPAPLLFRLSPPIVAFLIALVTLAVVATTAHRLRSLEPKDPVSIAMTLTAFALIMDPGWAHYYVVLCYAQPVLLATVRGRGWPWRAALCASSFALSSLSLFAVLLEPALIDTIYRLNTIASAGMLALAGLWSAAAHRAAGGLRAFS